MGAVICRRVARAHDARPVQDSENTAPLMSILFGAGLVSIRNQAPHAVHVASEYPPRPVEGRRGENRPTVCPVERLAARASRRSRRAVAKCNARPRSIAPSIIRPSCSIAAASSIVPIIYTPSILWGRDSPAAPTILPPSTHSRQGGRTV